MKKDIFTEFISFRIGSLARDLAKHLNSQFSQHGITIGQGLVLFYLTEHDSSSLKEIANTLELDSPSVSRLVDRLIKADLVTRKEDESDRRGIKVGLTDKGRELADKVFPISYEFNEYLKEEVIGKEKFEELGYHLAKIKEILK